MPTVGTQTMRYIIKLTITMELFFTGAACAQMSPEDIEALRRRGEKEGWTFEVGENWATRNSSARLCGLAMPENWREGARFETPSWPVRGERAAFDWRDWGGVTEVREQDPCGACWAFATVGVLESNIAIRDGRYVDLSEQWLLSCNSEGWGCDDPGWPAHDYHLEEPDPCGHTGAVLESSFLYAAAEVPCDCPYPHVYWISEWAYIASETVEDIKAAIVSHGPVWVGLHANYDAFKAYTGGIFNGCEDGEPDHAAILVGWNDSEGGGVWILRNSWGDDWGEAGYMRIPYGCSEVGFAANYIVYPYTFK